MKSDWTQAKICLTQQLFTPELHAYWMKSIRMFEKVPKYQKVISRIAMNFIKLCGIMRHFRNYAGLCGEDEIMRFRIHT